MRIAAVTDDGKTISAHFGRATKYAVYSVVNNQIANRELREKMGHHDFAHEGHHEHEDHVHGHGHGRHSTEKHRQMFTTITDCDILLARGMGQGAYRGLQELGIRPILTDIADIDIAVQAVMDGSIEDNPDRLH